MKPDIHTPATTLASKTDRPTLKANEAIAFETYRPAKQKRSYQSEKRLLDAAEKLFAERGFKETKVSDIIKKAKGSTGSFYHRFGDKDGLARVLVQRYVTEALGIISDLDLSRDTHGDLCAMLSYFAHEICQVITERMGAYRAAERLAQVADDSWPYTAVLVEALVNKTLEFKEDYAAEINAPDSDMAITNVVQLFIMVLLQTRLGAGPVFPKNDDALIAFLIDAAMGGLNPLATR